MIIEVRYSILSVIEGNQIHAMESMSEGVIANNDALLVSIIRSISLNLVER